MKNNRLIFFTAVHDMFQDFRDEAETELSDSDDGENFPADEARKLALDFLDSRIQQLHVLRFEIETQPVKKFMESKNLEY